VSAPACAIVAAALLAAPLPTPAPERITYLPSPEVAGGAVVFRLRAPRARDVVVISSFRAEKIPMERDKAGIWSVRVEGIPPGLHSYAFIVDSVRMADPSNTWGKPARGSPASVLEIPGSGELYEPRDVPRGAVHVHEYLSRALGRQRRLHVYVPPGHERGAALPAVYLLHGFSDTDATWSEYGRVHVLMDNLLAERRVRPAVVVLPDGHSELPRGGEVLPEYLRSNAASLARELQADIIPLVERHHRVRKGPGGRMVFGVAMGGHQALISTLGPSGLFRRAVAIIPPLLDETVALAARTRTPAWLMLSVPVAEPGAEALAAELRRRGATVVIRPEHGLPELWRGWRKDLVEMLPALLGP
jgi:enterochelin esterase family protein